MIDAAYIQYHRGRRDGSIPAPVRGDRYSCPCLCGLLMSRQWFTDVFEVSPELWRAQHRRVESPLRNSWTADAS